MLGFYRREVDLLLLLFLGFFFQKASIQVVHCGSRPKLQENKHRYGIHEPSEVSHLSFLLMQIEIQKNEQRPDWMLVTADLSPTRAPSSRHLDGALQMP